DFKSHKILLCTGLKDILPEIEGFSNCWGISILHCPYCHGYEVKGDKTAILANGEAAFNNAMLIYNWTKDLTVLTNGVSQLRQEEAEELEKLGVRIIETEISQLAHVNGKLETIHFADQTNIEAAVMYATVPFEQQSNLGEKLGCQLTPKGHINVDE